MAYERAGLKTAAFAPPGWRASAGTMTALAAREFAVCALEAEVHLLAEHLPGLLRARGALSTPLCGPEAMCARLLMAKAARTARRGGLVRIAVRSDDPHRPERRDAVLAAVDLALGRGAAGATNASISAMLALAA